MVSVVPNPYHEIPTKHINPSAYLLLFFPVGAPMWLYENMILYFIVTFSHKENPCSWSESYILDWKVILIMLIVKKNEENPALA